MGIASEEYRRLCIGVEEWLDQAKDLCADTGTAVLSSRMPRRTPTPTLLPARLSSLFPHPGAPQIIVPPPMLKEAQIIVTTHGGTPNKSTLRNREGSRKQRSLTQMQTKDNFSEGLHINFKNNTQTMIKGVELCININPIHTTTHTSITTQTHKP